MLSEKLLVFFIHKVFSVADYAKIACPATMKDPINVVNSNKKSSAIVHTALAGTVTKWTMSQQKFVTQEPKYALWFCKN